MSLLANLPKGWKADATLPTAPCDFSHLGPCGKKRAIVYLAGKCSGRPERYHYLVCNEPTHVDAMKGKLK